MPDLIDDILHALETKADDWAADVDAMRAKSRVNPPADTLEFAAEELRALAKRLRAGADEVDTDTYARLHSVSVQTVRGWCAAGALPGARRLASGEWRIPRAAVRRRLSRVS